MRNVMPAKKTRNPEKQVAVSVNKGGRDFKRTEDFKTIYVNSTQFGFTRWDFQIMFGTVASTRDPEHAQGREVATVIMTPQYAKALLLDYTKVLSDFEAKYGEINIGKDFLKEILDAQEAGTK